MTETLLEPVREPVREPVLSVRDLSVSFRSDTRTVHAVDGVSYDLAPGEVLAVVGESGCGKSVTSMAVMGLLPSTAHIGGSIRLGGRELVGAHEKELQKVRGKDIAMIFQEPMTSLNPVLTIGRRDRRSTAQAPGAEQEGRQGEGRRTPRTGRHPGPAAPHRRVPAPALRRHAAARDDRDRRRLRPVRTHR